MKDKIIDLYNSDNNIAYKSLLDLEIITTESNQLYEYFDELLNMLSSNKTFVRVRGFRLICFLSKWDVEDKINNNIDFILAELEDDKGIAVRHCLEKINLILIYKPELSKVIEDKLLLIDLSKYKESMQILIKKDIYYIIEHI